MIKLFLNHGAAPAPLLRLLLASVMLLGMLISGRTPELVASTTSSGVCHPTGRMQQSRSNFTATLLPDGQVLVAGGIGMVGEGLYCTDQALPSTELVPW